jgi:hypothetical protein
LLEIPYFWLCNNYCSSYRYETKCERFVIKKLKMSINKFQRETTLLLILALLFSLSSCDIFKPARDTKKDKVYEDDKGELGEIQGRRVYNPETGEYEIIRVVTGKLDTVSWVELPAKKFPPITSDGSFDGGGAPPTNSGTTTTTA